MTHHIGQAVDFDRAAQTSRAAVRPMAYLDMSTVQARRTTTPPSNRSRSGYGSKLPTAYQLQIDKRWHRVYVVCWSNCGTAYVVKGGQRIYIATGEL